IDTIGHNWESIGAVAGLSTWSRVVAAHAQVLTYLRRCWARTSSVWANALAPAEATPSGPTVISTPPSIALEGRATGSGIVRFNWVAPFWEPPPESTTDVLASLVPAALERGARSLATAVERAPGAGVSPW